MSFGFVMALNIQSLLW